MNPAEESVSLYPQFGTRIYNFLRRLTRDDTLAEDLTQETFLRAAVHAGAYRGDGSLSNWLHRIATNLFRDHLRKRRGGGHPSWESAQTTEEYDGAQSEVPDSGPPPADIVERQAVNQCVRDCVGALPGPYRTALLLNAIEDKPVEECAAILGCSPGAVKVRLHRARRLFKEVAAERCEVCAGERGGDITCLPKRR